MGHKLLIVLLAVGAVAGFAAGFARLSHGGFGHHGRYGGPWARHAEFERRIADTCAESAMRVYSQKTAGGKP